MEEAGAGGWLPLGSGSTGARLDSSDPQPSSTAASNQDPRAATPLNEAIFEPRPLDYQPFHASLSQFGHQSQPTTPSGATGIASTDTRRAAFSFGGAAVDPRHPPVHNIPSETMSGCDMPATRDPNSDDTPLTQVTWGTEFMPSPPTPVAPGSTSVQSLRDSLGPNGSPMKRRGSSSSSSSPPSIEVTTEPTTPYPSAESRPPSAIHRRVAKQLHPKPVADEESPSSQSSASESGAEGWSCGEGGSAAKTASSARSASDSAARASASVSAESDSSDPFPRPTPRSVAHRLVPLPFTSDSSSDNHGPPTRTRIPYSSRQPSFTSLPRDSSGQARYTALPSPTQVSTAVQTESVVHVHVHHHHPPHPHSHSHYQTSSHRTKSRTPDGHSSDQGNWSETNDQLSSLPQKSWIGRTSSQYFHRDSISDRWEEASAYSTLSARTARSNYSAQSAHSAHTAHSNHSVRSEPLMAPRPAVETVQLYRSMSVSGGLRPRRTTRPPRADEVEAAYRNLVDLTAYPVSPLGELMGVAQSDSVGMYPAGMAPVWASVAPRVRNTGGLAPHGSFTSRLGSRSLVPATPPSNVFSDTASTSTRSRRSGSSKGGSGGSRSPTKPGSLEASSSNAAKLFTPPSKAVKLDASSSNAAKVDTSSSTPSKLKSRRVPPSEASNDTTAAIGQLGNANLTRFQLNDLETAAKLGDQLAAYHLGWDDPPRRRLARSASLSLGLNRRTLSSTSLKVAGRPVPSRRTTIETENPSNKLDFAALSASSSSSSGAPQHGMFFFSGQTPSRISPLP